MQKVAIVRVAEAKYPDQFPYHPSEPYPEFPFVGHLSGQKNVIYDGIRKLFQQLGLDEKRYGTRDWNPLGFLIKPGMKVVIKPNFVLSRHKQGKSLFSIITHPSVLRAIADYVWIALKGRGKIVIADGPQYDCDFRELIEATRLDAIVAFYKKFSGPQVEILDLRSYWSRGRHFSSLLRPIPGDPMGSITINLDGRSALCNIVHPEKIYGSVYHREETIRHHREQRHEYEVSRTVMEADVVISVPKLKVHKKVGVTLNAKGLVGICTNKNYLVHYRVTPPSQGGDQYPDGLFSPMEEMLIKTERWMYDHLLARRKRLLEYLHRSIYALHNQTVRRIGLKVKEEKRLFDAGNWHGNDSCWRMMADLMKVFHFADCGGHLHSHRQRRTFSVIDGVIGGDKNGPLMPDPVESAVLLAGQNFLAVDLVATRLMGFNPLKVRAYRYLLENRTFDFGVHGLDEIQILCSDPSWANCLKDSCSRFLDFTPHPGWIGFLEIKPRREINTF